MSSVLCHKWKLDSGLDAHIKVLQINRPEKAGAMNAEVLDALYENLHDTHKNCQALVLLSSGKHFSAGGDLAWMKESAKLSEEQNIRDAKKLDLLFATLANLHCPTISVVQGACYGGGVGLAAASDIVLSETKSRYCLSEVKIGLLPAVIYPYLQKVVQPRMLREWSLTAKVVDAGEALRGGLVSTVIDKYKIAECLIQKLELILSACGERQHELKQMTREISMQNNATMRKTTVEYIAKARMSQSGQEGLSAFFEKRAPSWQMQLTDQIKSELTKLVS